MGVDLPPFRPGILADGSRTDCLLMVAVFSGLVAALLVVPTLVPSRSAGVVSAAAAVGYNTAAAFWTAFVWSVLVILLFAWRSVKEARERKGAGRPNTVRGIESGDRSLPGTLIWGELLSVFAVFALAYFPFFLARHGPYMEDVYFLAALMRMDCGQLPYLDFGFLYGPLMIYPLWAWSKFFDSGMVSYFGFLALLEGLQFAILMGVLQLFVPQRGKRWCIFLLLLPLLLNTLLGLNYNGMRRLIPALAVLLVANRPYDGKVIAGCALLLGLNLAYSHEYAIAALAGVVAVYAIDFFWGKGAESLKAASMTVVGSVTVWLAITVLVLGDTVPAYVQHTREVVGMMSGGHAGFRFYWTANSLALFGLLTIACAAIGKGLLPRMNGELHSGDRMMFGAMVLAIVMLKSGLTRSDLWHLNAGFLALLLVFLLPLPFGAMAITRIQQKVAYSLVSVVSLTYLVGIAPTGSLYAFSYVAGFLDVLSGRSKIMEVDTRSRSIEFERTEPRPDFAALGSYLADPERSGRPVLFYGRAWFLPPLVGVCAKDYKLDDLMYSEFRSPDSAYLSQHPEALVVLRRADYEHLYGITDKSTPVSRVELTPTKRLGRWLSTVHYDAADIEGRLQDQAREVLTGKYLPMTHMRAAGFGDYTVLVPK